MILTLIIFFLLCSWCSRGESLPQLRKGTRADWEFAIQLKTYHKINNKRKYIESITEIFEGVGIRKYLAGGGGGNTVALNYLK